MNLKQITVPLRESGFTDRAEPPIRFLVGAVEGLVLFQFFGQLLRIVWHERFWISSGAFWSTALCLCATVAVFHMLFWQHQAKYIETEVLEPNPAEANPSMIIYDQEYLRAQAEHDSKHLLPASTTDNTDGPRVIPIEDGGPRVIPIS